MKTIQILGQKTVVADSKDSRNSIRPLLEEAGFGLEYDRVSRILQVKEGRDILVKIIGVKGIQDFERLASETQVFPYLLAVSDIIAECVGERAREILDMEIGTCFLKIITSSGNINISPGDFQRIITKYPKTLARLLGKKAEKKTKIPQIEYSDSPDTTLALLETINKEKRKQRQNKIQDQRLFERMCFETEYEIDPEARQNIAAWEIVETGNSVRKLGLEFGDVPDLNITVSTQLFSQRPQSDIIEPNIQYFIQKIQETLGNKKSFT